MFKEFRDFIQRGNVINRAVAVIMDAAFGAIIMSLIAGYYNPTFAKSSDASDAG